jgi:hypothetical protein
VLVDTQTQPRLAVSAQPDADVTPTGGKLGKWCSHRRDERKAGRLSAERALDAFNRMPVLMQLHANRQDDERACVRHIREILEADQGRPSIARRAIIDAGGGASLR